MSDSVQLAIEVKIDEKNSINNDVIILDDINIPNNVTRGTSDAEHLSHFQEIRKKFERQPTLRFKYDDKILRPFNNQKDLEDQLSNITCKINSICLPKDKTSLINYKERRRINFDNLLEILEAEQKQYTAKAEKYKRIVNATQYLIGGFGSLTIIAQAVGMPTERVSIVQFLSGAMTALTTILFNYTNMADSKTRFEGLADGTRELIEDVIKDFNNKDTDIEECISKINIIRKHKLKVELNIDVNLV
jgi:hypothetical protein